MINHTKYKDFLAIIIIYSCAFFSILLNDGLFWDGWVINNSSSEQLIQMFKDNGNYWYGYSFALIKSTGYMVLLSRVITFLTYLTVGLIFYQIIKRYTFELSKYSLIVTLYFITFPVNFARVTIMNTPYAICLMFFALAYYLALKKYNNFFEICIVSILLFLSLFMSSLLFLVPVLLLHKFLFHSYSFNFKSVKNFLFSNIFLVLVPMAYVFIKLIFLDSGGMYQDSNYNQITINRLVVLPFRFLEALYGSIVLPINLSISYAVSNSILVLIFLFALNKVRIFSEDAHSSKNILNISYKKLLICSFALLFLGMIAYLLVGKTPSLTNWNSRHQILVPIGASIFLFSIIYFGLTKIKNENIRKQIALLPIAIFITFNVNIYFSYIIDWYKQVSFIENVMESDKLMSSPTFIIVDNTKELNALSRSKSFMDYTGIFKQRLLSENKLADEIYMLDSNEYLKYKLDKVYGISDWEPSMPEYVVYLNYGSFSVDNLVILKMIFNKFSGSNKNLNNTKNILDIEVKKIGSYNDQ